MEYTVFAKIQIIAIILAQSHFVLFCYATQPPKPDRHEDKDNVGEKLKATQRLLQIEKLAFALWEIENCIAIINEFSNSPIPDVQRLVKSKQDKLKIQLANMKKFEEGELVNDPSLLKHAKMMMAEEDRLNKIDMAKGKEYFESEERKSEYAKKIAEYCKQFEAPERKSLPKDREIPNQPNQLTPEQRETLEYLEKRMPNQEKMDALKRLVDLQQLFFALSGIEMHEILIKEFENDPNPELRAGVPRWKASILQYEKVIESYSSAFKKDPSLLKHAKMILAESNRLDEVDQAKGEKYLNDPKNIEIRGSKITEYMKKFDKPEPVDPKKEPGTPK